MVREFEIYRSTYVISQMYSKFNLAWYLSRIVEHGF